MRSFIFLYVYTEPRRPKKTNMRACNHHNHNLVFHACTSTCPLMCRRFFPPRVFLALPFKTIHRPTYPPTSPIPLAPTLVWFRLLLLTSHCISLFCSSAALEKGIFAFAFPLVHIVPHGTYTESGECVCDWQSPRPQTTEKNRESGHRHAPPVPVPPHLFRFSRV